LKAKRSRSLGRCWSFFVPMYFLAAAALDHSEVTNGEYLKFVAATHHAAPEYWVNGRIPAGKENEPVVLVNFHDGNAYCRFFGRRLPTVDEWKSTCEAASCKSAAISGSGLRPTSIWAGKLTKRYADQRIHATARIVTCRIGKMK
jgi:formylglycine-generating enzyme required for sulfatase activity